jgi:hypothetical protein
MARSERPLPERNAGAFMGPDIMVPVPMGTLGDEPLPADQDVDDDRPRAKPRSGWLRRLVDRLTMRPRA